MNVLEKDFDLEERLGLVKSEAIRAKRTRRWTLENAKVRLREMGTE